MCVYERVLVTDNGQLVGFSSSSHNVGSRKGTRVARFDGGCLHPQSYVTHVGDFETVSCSRAHLAWIRCVSEVGLELFILDLPRAGVTCVCYHALGRVVEVGRRLRAFL